MSYQPRLKTKYKEEIVASLMEQFQYQTIMKVPRIEKVCLNQGVGLATADKKLVDNALSDMSLIAGQKAVPTIARKSISNFKLRDGMPIGARVTLRNDQMWDFLERLIAIALPRSPVAMGEPSPCQSGSVAGSIRVDGSAGLAGLLGGGL